MAMILSSKNFDIPQDSVMSWDFEDVRKFLAENILNNPNKVDRRVVITFQDIGNNRQKKYSLRARLKELIADMNLGSETLWRSGEYRFDFMFNTYSWNDKEIYITAGEALYLFYRLIKKQNFSTSTGYINKLRHRLGKAFLKGII